MSAPARPRPHRRAVRQLLLGLVPLLLVGLALIAVLAVKLAAAREPLDGATASGVATVRSTGHAPDGRGVAVSLAGGRSGVLVLAAASDAAGIPPGTRLGVSYDPSDPPNRTAVYINGDAAHARVQDLVFGLGALVVVLVVTTALTVLRLVSRPRL